jgi:tetratricopeptide (TPR) repeat protein
MPGPVVVALRMNMFRALAENRLKDAEDILLHLRREDPLSQETRGFELELLLNSNRAAEADALARQLFRLFPDSARIAFLAGKSAYRLRHYDEAEDHFRESQRLYPHWRTQQWLGKTLTQSGRFAEAEALLLRIHEQMGGASLDLAWLYERKGDLETALRLCEEYIAAHPGQPYAEQQRVRLKARMLEPEALIEEVGALADLGEDVPPMLFPEFVQRLFETGQTEEARAKVAGRIRTLDATAGSRVAWVCYRARAYDLAFTLFVAHLRSNLSYFKYLNALEAAARRCARVPDLAEAYTALLPEAPHLHGRLKKLQHGKR